MRLKNFINGDFVSPKEEKYTTILNPATGEEIAEAPDSHAIDAVQAIRSANQAFESWSQTAIEERARLLHKIADLIDRDKDELAELESANVGKPLWLAKKVDLPRTILNFRYFADRIKIDSTQSRDSFARLNQYTLRAPLGVTALIAPWNLPLYTLTYKLAPSLAVGNTVVCKPSEYTPLTAFKLANLLVEAGLPAGVCNIVFGTGLSVGEPLVQHPGVHMVSFTGGTETGKRIQSLTSTTLKRTSLELGGKNANIILNDANLAEAVQGAIRASFLNSGQICLCGSRLLIQQDVYKEFMQEFRLQTKSLSVGDPRLPDTFMGPLISSQHREKVSKAISQAESEGGKVTVGGKIPSMAAPFDKGYFLEPTIIEDLTNCSDLWQTEIFGPVVTTMGFKYPHEAVKWANTSPFGLSASLWTQDVTRAHKLAQQIQAGTIWVNTWAARDVGVAFGGLKASGLGREGGEESLRTYTELKTIAINS